MEKFSAAFSRRDAITKQFGLLDDSVSGGFAFVGRVAVPFEQSLHDHPHFCPRRVIAGRKVKHLAVEKCNT